MAVLAGRSLISCPEAYSESLKSFSASLEPKHTTIKCLEEHVVPLISDVFQDQSPFCILSVGSGRGHKDLSFIEMLSKAVGGKTNKLQFLERALEPDETRLESFRAKAKDLPESLKSRANIEFELLPVTYQEYVEQKKKDDVKFDVVHFIQSIYYVSNVETALKHCYEKELGPKGVIFSITEDGKSAYTRYGRAFSSEGLILNPGAYYSNVEVTDAAKKNGWKYEEFADESTNCDITAIFDHSSVKGNLLLDFLTHRVNVRQTTSQENLQRILDFWENECIVDDRGRKMVKFPWKTVMILKGV